MIDKVLLAIQILMGTESPEPPRFWHYQLQNYQSLDLKKLPDERGVLVIDYSRDGSDQKRFRPNEIQKLKGEKNHIILSYLSIGEAETYRYYFKSMNKSLLLNENKLWKGNINVQYWQEDWQNIFLADDGYLQRIISAGFDGVYLDIVDAYLQHPKRVTAPLEMIRFVQKLKEYAERYRPGFRIVVQNAPCIWERFNFKHLTDDEYQSVYQDYLKSIWAQAAESTFFFGESYENNSYKPQKYVLHCLKKLHADGVPVFAVDYVYDRDEVVRFHAESQRHGFIGLVTDRKLKNKYMHYPQTVTGSRWQRAMKVLGH